MAKNIARGAGGAIGLVLVLLFVSATAWTLTLLQRPADAPGLAPGAESAPLIVDQQTRSVLTWVSVLSVLAAFVAFASFLISLAQRTDNGRERMLFSYYSLREGAVGLALFGALGFLAGAVVYVLGSQLVIPQPWAPYAWTFVIAGLAALLVSATIRWLSERQWTRKVLEGPPKEGVIA